MPTASVDTEKTTIPGPAGALEALVDMTRRRPSAVAVVCHPHPLHQGTMHNKVAYTLSRCFARLGAVSVRFNFRGVGESAGGFDEGDGETDDAVAVVDWGLRRWPGVGLYLGGFSFGAVVALRAAHLRRARGLVTIAPPVHGDRDLWRRPECRWLLLQGTDDEVVPSGDVDRWARAIVPPPEIRAVQHAGHFFHGRLAAITDSVTEFFAADFDFPEAHGDA
jgi:alpha/beta superfamily hydrolase